MNRKRPTASRCACLARVLGLLMPIVWVSAPAEPAGSARQAGDPLPVCAYVASYAPGYSWSDGVERGLRQTLAGRCTVVPEYMNTKTHFSERYKRAAGRRAFELINEVDPDIVITSDDNAAKYLIEPYLKNTKRPVVFSGINWTVEEYGLPAPNVTGIVEVAPLLPLLEAGRSLAEGGRQAVYLGADNESQRKDLRRIQDLAESLGMHVTGDLSTDFDGWRAGLQRAQNYDIVILGSFTGIRGWDMTRAVLVAEQLTRRPTVTAMDWSMPLAHLGVTKISEEHGEWAGAAVLAILDGASPSDIPLATNRKWDLWINPGLIERSDLVIDPHLLQRAKTVP